MSEVVEMRWIPWSEQPPVGHRPGRQFIRIEGWKAHSGLTWMRTYCGIARTINPDQPESFLDWGFYADDIRRLMKDGDMDGVDEITHWMPVIFPTVTGRREP